MKVKRADIINVYPQKEILFKFLVIGEFGAGKTAIVRRYTENKFSSNYKITIGADFAIKTIQWDKDTRINLQLWDIAGHERFGHMTRVYYKYAVGAAVVFDLTRLDTLRAVDKWIVDLRDKVVLCNEHMVPIILLANKSDILENTIPTENITKICRENGIQAWYMTSAKNNENIDEAFHHLVELAIRNKSKSPSEMIDSNSIQLGSSPTKNSPENQPKKDRFACCN